MGKQFKVDDVVRHEVIPYGDGIVRSCAKNGVTVKVYWPKFQFSADYSPLCLVRANKPDAR